jgi:hypothetical protein
MWIDHDEGIYLARKKIKFMGNQVRHILPCIESPHQRELGAGGQGQCWVYIEWWKKSSCKWTCETKNILVGKLTKTKIKFGNLKNTQYVAFLLTKLW